MARYTTRKRTFEPKKPPTGFNEALPSELVDAIADYEAPDPTHLVQDTGHARWRMSRCGVACAEGRLEYERRTHGSGSSTLANVDCEACLRLDASDKPTAAKAG